MCRFKLHMCTLYIPTSSSYHKANKHASNFIGKQGTNPSLFCLLLARKNNKRIQFKLKVFEFSGCLDPKIHCLLQGAAGIVCDATALDLHFKCMLVCCRRCGFVPTHCGLLLGQLLVLTMPLTADDSISFFSCCCCCCLNARACGPSSFCGHVYICSLFYDKLKNMLISIPKGRRAAIITA